MFKPHIEIRQNFCVREFHHINPECIPVQVPGQQIVWVYPHTHDLGVDRVVQV
jgi:hypothetical protein